MIDILDEDQSGIENLNNIDRVLTLFGMLNNLIKNENIYLDKMQLDEVEKLQPEKIKLGRWLQIFESYLKLNNSWYKDQENDKKENLRKLYIEFNQIISENHQKLEKAVAVNEYILKMVAREVKVIDGNVTYNKSGQKEFGTILASNDNAGLSITLNQKI